jgi:hypothetical protein
MKSLMSFASVMGFASLVGCGSDGNYVLGTENSPCNPDLTCNTGLTCISDTCVIAGIDGSIPADGGAEGGGADEGLDAASVTSLTDAAGVDGQTALISSDAAVSMTDVPMVYDSPDLAGSADGDADSMVLAEP